MSRHPSTRTTRPRQGAAIEPHNVPRTREQSRILIAESLSRHEDSSIIALQAQPILKQYYPKIYALIFWLSLIATYWGITRYYGLETTTILQNLSIFFAESFFGPFFFVIVYAIQPLVFFPTALMTVMAGNIYGPVFGFIYTAIGASGAAMVTYWIGRFFGRGVLDDKKASNMIVRYADALRDNTFMALLIMHLLFLPYDLLNYLSGFLRLDWKAFLSATVIGSIPGMLTFVLFGASLEGDMLSGKPELNWETLLFAFGMLVVSLIIARIVRWRSQIGQENEAN